MKDEALKAQLIGLKKDGEIFSWYGSRLLNATVYFSNFIT